MLDAIDHSEKREEVQGKCIFCARASFVVPSLRACLGRQARYFTFPTSDGSQCAVMSSISLPLFPLLRGQHGWGGLANVSFIFGSLSGPKPSSGQLETALPQRNSPEVLSCHHLYGGMILLAEAKGAAVLAASASRGVQLGLIITPVNMKSYVLCWLLHRLMLHIWLKVIRGH